MRIILRQRFSTRKFPDLRYFKWLTETKKVPYLSLRWTQDYTPAHYHAGENLTVNQDVASCLQKVKLNSPF